MRVSERGQGISLEELKPPKITVYHELKTAR